MLVISRVALFGFLVALGLAIQVTDGQAQYAAGEFTVGQKEQGLAQRGFSCSPSDDFPETIRCDRSKSVQGPSGATSEKSVVMQAKDGTVLYSMKHTTHGSLARSVIEDDIREINRALGRAAKSVEWQTDEHNTPVAVIALWGEAQLSNLNFEGRAALEEGKGAKQGMLVDLRGDLTQSAKDGEPIYRIVGGTGLVYTARLGKAAFRRVSAIDPDALLLMLFSADILALFRKDQTLSASDTSLWPDVAERARSLAMDTSLDLADRAIDLAAQKAPSKLASKLWPRLPGSVTIGLKDHAYRPGVDHYMSKSKFPALRAELQDFVRRNPSDRFIEFAHYALGDPDAGLEARPGSEVRDVLHYAIAHRAIRQLARDAIEAARARSNKVPKGFNDSSKRLSFINSHPEIFDSRPVASFVPTFAIHAQKARPHLKAVLETPKTAIADDAGYYLGLLESYEGNREAALKYLETSMVSGNGDFKIPAAMRQAIRILMSFPALEQIEKVEASSVFSAQPPIVYTTGRSAYREHQYALVIEFLERALPRLKLPVARMPSTTDPKRIEEALRRIFPENIDSDDYDWNAELHLSESIYLLEASREILSYVDYIKSLQVQQFDADVLKRARSIIIKYSLIIDKDSEQAAHNADQEVQHRDLRQAIHLIDVTLESTPRAANYQEFRGWLHYRKIRALTRFAPAKVREAVAVLLQESPASKFVDDAITEQIFADGVVQRNIESAERAFQLLAASGQGGNAIDNAHSWMAISYSCANRQSDARRINNEIVRRFPLTRHATYARVRLAQSGESRVCVEEEAFDGTEEDEEDIENLTCLYNLQPGADCGSDGAE